MARVIAVVIIAVVGFLVCKCSCDIYGRVVGSSSFWVTIFFCVPVATAGIFPVFLAMPSVCTHMARISVRLV